MPARLRVADHPVHPALVHLPIGLWFGALAWNGVAWVRPDPLWWQLGYWCLALGLLAAVPTILAGLLDYLALAPDEPAIDAATAHMMVMLSATAAFAAGWLLRAGTGATLAPPLWAIVCELAGGTLLAIGGWLGGTLVYRHRLGAAHTHGGPTSTAGKPVPSDPR